MGISGGHSVPQEENLEEPPMRNDSQIQNGTDTSAYLSSLCCYCYYSFGKVCFPLLDALFGGMRSLQAAAGGMKLAKKRVMLQ